MPTVPGIQNPAVTDANIRSTICVPGWSKTQRPNTAYTNKIKFRLMDAAGIPRSQSRQYELDHEWSIEAGGSPTDPRNLWLQPYFGPINAHQKDKVENAVHRSVCSGQITVEQAGAELHNWVATYRSLIGPLP
jgi:hypothetical protein